MSLLDRVRCVLFGDACPTPWNEDDDEVLQRTRALTDQANREADELRVRRLTLETVYGLNGREGGGDAGRG